MKSARGEKRNWTREEKAVLVDFAEGRISAADAFNKLDRKPFAIFAQLRKMKDVDIVKANFLFIALNELMNNDIGDNA